PHGGAAVVEPDDVGRVGIGVLDRVEVEAVRVVGGARAAAAAAQLVQHARLGDAVDPGAEGAARRVVGVGLAPDGEEDLLDDLLGGRAVEHLRRHAEDEVGVAAVERAERPVLAGGQPRDEPLVRPGLGRRIGPWFHGTYLRFAVPTAAEIPAGAATTSADGHRHGRDSSSLPLLGMAADPPYPSVESTIASEPGFSW